MEYANVPVIEIVCGREALWGIRNRNMIPIGGLVSFRNATLEDQTWRTGGGASKLGSAAASATIQAGVDYWPTLTLQRNVVSLSDGTIQKDDGNGASWAALVSGLTASGQVPHFNIGGAERVGRSRKLFHADRVNPMQVLAADGASMAAIVAPPVDWSGSNQPGFSVIHDGYNWAGGNANNPHMIYRSLREDHEDFLSSPYQIPIFPGEGERLVGGMSYKGGLVLWKHPEGVYFVPTSDPSESAWRAVKIGRAGAAGPYCMTQAEDDVPWIAPDGTWHLIGATTATGSVRAEDISARKLGAWGRDNMNLSQLPSAHLVYYSHKQELMLACHAAGVTQKGRRLHLDFADRRGVGERWIWWDRDRNEALWLRKKNLVQIPAMGDASGQVWELDRAARNAEGQPYTFEWLMADTDCSPIMPGWQGRKKNLRFLQVEHDSRGSATHTIEVYRDGQLRQTLVFAFTAGQATLPATLPITLGAETLQVTKRRELKGQATRLALRGYTTGTTDVSLARILLGLELAA